MSNAQNIQVFVRCRPLNANEKASVVEVIPEKHEVKILDRKFTEHKSFYFDEVFGPEAEQINVYRSVVKPLIDQVLLGFNCTVFAYGQTGTGKTYTMEGDRCNEELDWENDPNSGMIPRAISQLFDTLRDREGDYSVRVSFIELYNEDTYDLLSNIEDPVKLRIFDGAQRKVIVGNLEEVAVQSRDEIYEILKRGSAKRQTAATLLNACSSRSHTIFTVTVQIREGSIEGEDVIKIGKLNLVDLAGSENIGRSGAKDNRAREAGNINQSLLTLGRVITALVEKRPHIPYRESKLTRLLQDSLGGKTKTSIIATISPSPLDVDDTASTLDYATRARKIINLPELNQHIRHKQSLDNLNKENQVLKDRLSEQELRIRQDVALEFQRECEKMKARFEEDYLKRFQEMEKKFKVAEELADYRKGLLEEIQDKLRSSEYELKFAREKIRELEEKASENHQTIKKATRVRGKAPVLDECGDYANMTFDGGDEIAQVSAKKNRKKVVAGAKKRTLNQSITLSGKKRKLRENDDACSSPILPSPPARATRSRTTKRKLNF